MSQEIEIEFKNMLTLEEFEKLKSSFSLTDEDFVHQVNHYFDTREFSLKDKGSALRVRKRNDLFTLTMKQPAQTGLLETHQTLTEAEAKAILKGGTLPEGEVPTAIRKLGIDPDQVVYFGSLETSRAETKFKEGILVLDNSFYLNTEDFEVEYEVADEKTGYEDFLQLLELHSIPVRKTENKIKRFYREKQNQSF